MGCGVCGWGGGEREAKNKERLRGRQRERGECEGRGGGRLELLYHRSVLPPSPFIHSFFSFFLLFHSPTLSLSSCMTKSSRSCGCRIETTLGATPPPPFPPPPPPPPPMP